MDAPAGQDDAPEDAGEAGRTPLRRGRRLARKLTGRPDRHAAGDGPGAGQRRRLAQDGPVGLDGAPRPASSRDRVVQGLIQSAPFSSLQRRIIFFNLAGLALLVAGALYLNQFRSGLIDQRLDNLRVLGEIVALTMADGKSLDPGAPDYDPVAINRGLNRLIEPAGLRAQLYDDRLRLVADTRPPESLAAAALAGVPAAPPAPSAEPGPLERLVDAIEAAYGAIERAMRAENVPLAEEVPRGGISRDLLVREAAKGQVVSTVRLNAREQLIVSIAMPVRQGQRAAGGGTEFGMEFGAGFGAGLGTGPDTGLDAGSNTGPDAGPDAGPATAPAPDRTAGAPFREASPDATGQALDGAVSVPLSAIETLDAAPATVPILGILVLSTEGDDINTIVRAERATILQVFVIAAIVSTGLSVLLANTIAKPIRRLAAAAESGSPNSARPLTPERVEIPDMTHRTDEIGELSASLIRMTEALYDRIEAIESFASDVAHEIKNPLTSLRSAVETMAYARTPEQRQKLLDVIQNDVGRLDRLVTDISNASRLDADLVRERMETFDLGALLDMLQGVFQAQGEKTGVAVALEMPEAGLRARGMESRIAQVVTNLIDNALSFSPPGSTVRTRAERRAPTRERQGCVRVSVEDRGPGVPPDNLESVFQRFYTERPESQGFGNHSGLGLAISRQIIEAHGGTIWVENVQGPDGAVQGARFVFELPDQAPEAGW